MFVTALGAVVLGTATALVGLVTGHYWLILGLPVGIVAGIGIAVYAANHVD
jgi:hypothetical protein